jgi:hypothetical protein
MLMHFLRLLFLMELFKDTEGTICISAQKKYALFETKSN